MYRLLGMAVPFGVRTPNPIVPGSFIYEAFCQGAFDQQTLDDAWLSRICVNHSKAYIEDAEISLHNAYSGLYFSVFMPNSAEARALMDQRAQWRGVSISFFKDGCDGQVDWPSNTHLITRVDFINHIGICVGDSTPAYPTTWVSEFSSGALDRMKRENNDALERVLGANYRDRWSKDSWDAPLQSTRGEAVLRAHDPARQHRIVTSWGCGTLVRQYRA